MEVHRIKWLWFPNGNLNILVKKLKLELVTPIVLLQIHDVEMQMENDLKKKK